MNGCNWIRIRTASAVAAGLFAATIAHGHGLPVRVGVDARKLSIANGVADDAGFAPMVFYDGSADGAPDSFSHPVLGNVLLYTLPGFEIHDMAVGSGLYLDVLARPVRGSSPIDARLLWHWNPASETVAQATHGEVLTLLNGFASSITLPQAPMPQPPPFKVAEPLAGDLGQHQHLLAYALDNSPSAATGAYGFFARLTSPGYLASDPLLIVLNNGLAAGQLATAASAINVAALLAGDYNHDDVVNMADYTLWKQQYLGTISPFAGSDGNGNGNIDAADYTVWRNSAGNSYGAGAAFSRAIPEPGSLVLFACGLAMLLLHGCRRLRCVLSD